MFFGGKVFLMIEKLAWILFNSNMISVANVSAFTKRWTLICQFVIRPLTQWSHLLSLISPTDGPEFFTHPQSETKKEGENTSLSCNATGNPKPTISWYKDDTKINAGADSRVSISEDDTQLTITNVSRNDDGQYTCVASNSLGNSTSNSATLTVQCKYLACSITFLIGGI